MVMIVIMIVIMIIIIILFIITIIPLHAYRWTMSDLQVNYK